MRRSTLPAQLRELAPWIVDEVEAAVRRRIFPDRLVTVAVGRAG
jgi:hypothetical protein